MRYISRVQSSKDFKSLIIPCTSNMYTVCKKYKLVQPFRKVLFVFIKFKMCLLFNILILLIETYSAYAGDENACII